jgi:hypothetical protein
VAKNWNGTTLGWADIEWRLLTNPVDRNQVAGYDSIANALS